MGIGRRISELFASEGAAVVINSRSLERAEPVCEALQARGLNAIAVAQDVSRRAGAAALVDETVRRLGRLDILVNNAGVFMVAPAQDLSEDDWRNTIDTDLSGAFFCAQEAFFAMKANGGGTIVNVSSILGETAFPLRAAYCAAKHALNGLTKVLAIEWAEHRIRVNTLSPAYIASKPDTLDKATTNHDLAAIKRRTPLGRFGTQDEVARAALYLASDDSSYMTGSTLTLDGGWLANGAW